MAVRELDLYFCLPPITAIFGFKGKVALGIANPFRSIRRSRV